GFPCRREFLRRSVGDEVGAYLEEGDLLPECLRRLAAFVERLDVARVHDAYESLVFVAVGFRNDEQHLHAVAGEPARQPVARRTQTAGYMRREFPSEHQYPHWFLLFFVFFFVLRRRLRALPFLFLRFAVRTRGLSLLPPVPYHAFDAQQGAHAPCLRNGAALCMGRVAVVYLRDGADAVAAEVFLECGEQLLRFGQK